MGKANPTGSILSAAMLLRFSLGLEAEAAAVEAAVEAALIAGACTADIARMTGKSVSTSEFKDTVIANL
jgi:3-isopropylmalate dehydrogenase